MSVKTFLLLVLLPALSYSQDDLRITTPDQSFLLTPVVKNIPSPWAGQFLPDGTLLGTSRTGNLWTYSQGKFKTIPLNLPVDTRGQGGLLDLALDPQFATNSLVYFSFSQKTDSGSRAALARGLWTGSRVKEIKVLWNNQRPTSSLIQYGSRIAFGPDGMLYLSLGDRGAPSRAQDPGDSAGKVLRLTPEGQPAPGNPFINSPGYLPEIYTLGHRNPQGLVWEPESTRLWLTEHGPKGGDEVNLLLPGVNYGWPLITYGINYDGTIITPDTHRPGLAQPEIYWVPSIAPSGLVYYKEGPLTGWKGSLFSGNLAGKELKRISLSPQGKILAQETLLKNAIGRIRDVILGPEGFLYLLTDGTTGTLYRLSP